MIEQAAPRPRPPPFTSNPSKRGGNQKSGRPRVKTKPPAVIGSCQHLLNAMKKARERPHAARPVNGRVEINVPEIEISQRACRPEVKNLHRERNRRARKQAHD